MKIIGQKVEHKTMGVGVITSYSGKEQNNNKYIMVEFATKKIEFPFPSAFQKHLSALDTEFDIAIKDELSAISQEKKKSSADVKEIFIPKLYSSKNTITKPKSKELLTLGNECGTNSKVVYLNCCQWFGWDKNQKNNFGMQGTLLYAKKATPEGYSPWFISHHNLQQTQGGKWSNTIENDYIHEEWHTADERLWDDKSIRVVFLKLNGKYYFYGLFEVCSIKQKENFKYVKTYKRIANKYPH